MKKEYKANIVISNIEVDDRYYSFDYEVKIKDVCDIKSSYENDYCNGMTKEEWKNYLEESDFCLRTTLETMSDEI